MPEVRERRRGGLRGELVLPRVPEKLSEVIPVFEQWGCRWVRVGEAPLRFVSRCADVAHVPEKTGCVSQEIRGIKFVGRVGSEWLTSRYVA